jgi:hypothetical protein
MTTTSTEQQAHEPGELWVCAENADVVTLDGLSTDDITPRGRS